MKLWKIMVLMAFVFLFINLFNSSAYARSNAITNKTIKAAAQSTNSTKTTIYFDVEQAYAKLKIINDKLAQNKQTLHQAQLLSSQLIDMRDEAQACVTKSENRLKSINKLFASIKLLSDQATVQKSEEYKYLQIRKDIAAQRASDCRLFLLRSNEPLEAYKKIVQKLRARYLLKRTTTVLSAFKSGAQITFKKFDCNKVYQLSGINDLSLRQLIILICIVLLALVLAIFISYRCNNWLKLQGTQQKVSIAFMHAIKIYIIPLLIFAAISGYLFAILGKIIPTPSILLLSYSLFGYISLLAILNFVLSPAKPAAGMLYKTPIFARALFIRLSLLGTLLLLGILAAIILRSQPQTLLVIKFLRTCFFIVLSCAVVWVCWLFSKLPFFADTKQLKTIIMKIALLLLLVVIIIAQILGYHRLAVYLLSRLFLTFAAVFLFCLIINIMHKVERLFNNEAICDFASKFRDFFGLRSGKKFTEFVFIKIAIFLVALYLLVMALLLIWSVSLSTIHKIDQAVIDGFTFANIHIEPLRIVIALFLFGVLLACGRWLAHYISRHRKFTGEKDVQVTMDSIVNYATFALVLLISLLVAGVNFTGLAVIAGALSVGIGLGLQVIVNNFVSGIILLLDKNINPGDLILVNGVEGVIKKISLRSTLVTTLANEDVIIPNTELYTNRVTNYMLRGKYGRIATHIGVAHGCKIETVKNILLEVVKQQPDILQEEPNQPRVLFAEFSATSMNFSLFYTVKDVKKKLQIASDLSIAIEKALERNNIEIKAIAK